MEERSRFVYEAGELAPIDNTCLTEEEVRGKIYQRRKKIMEFLFDEQGICDENDAETGGAE